MTKLEQLIQDLCPNGVKIVPLWSVTAWDKHFKGIDKSMQQKIVSYPYLLAADLFALDTGEGDVFLLSTGAKTGWTTVEKAGEYLREGEVVAIPWGGTPNVKYHKGKFVTADNRIATSLDTNVLSNKFLYYWMNNNIDLIASFYRGAGIQHPSMYDILSLQIPLPPLAVQSEIVRLLDKFTLYKSELAAELAARCKQYEHYRNQLLTFDENTKRVKLGEIGKICMCKRILKSETNTESGIPFYKIGTFGKSPDAYISEDLFEEYKKKYNYPLKGQILISASGTIGRTVIFDGEPAYFQDSNIIWIDNREELVLNKFLYYYYQLQPWNVSTGGTIARLYSYNIENTVIPLPPLEVQERIVAILDRFDALCNDIKIGLPAEIELRQKQYEHYRDRLLTFEAKGD